MTEHHELLAFAHRLADASGDAIRPLFRAPLDAIDKSKPDGYYEPVTQADRAAEAAMRTLITATYPEHGILGEEHGRERLDAEYYWCLDPIDGTKSFVVGYPTFGTLIGLNHRGTVEIGIMNQPITNERFVGCPDGAFFGKQRLKTRPCADLESAILGFSGPWIFTTEAEKEVIKAISDRCMLTMNTGDCYNYCMLAMGRMDLIVESKIYPYDIQALIPIVEQAGGVITTWEGGDPAMGELVVAAGDPRLHEQVLPLLQDAAARNGA